MKKISRLFALFLALLMMFALFAGCGSKQDENNAAGTQSLGTRESIYPVADEPVTITGWGDCPPMILNYVTDGDIGTIANIKAAEEATNIHVEWVMVSDDQQMSIMLAGNDIPDILTYLERNYSGGKVKLFADGICVDLAEYGAEWAPDWYEFYTSNDYYASKISTGDGKVASMFGWKPYIDSGTMIRKDWLDDLEMEIPQTYDELTAVLQAFATEKGAAMAVGLSRDGAFGGNAPGWLTGGYGINLNDGDLTSDLPWQIDENGKVQMSFAMEGALEYFTMVHEWYKAGLTNSDIFSYDAVGGNDTLQLLLNNEVGFTWGSVTSLAESTKELAQDSAFELVALPDITKSKGDTIKTGGLADGVTSFGGAVSADSDIKSIEYAMKFLNWLWTADGIKASNFGENGKTYHYDASGNMYWDDLIIKNPDGLALKTAQYAYVGYVALGYRMDYNVVDMSFSNDAQRAALGIWTSNRADDYLYYGVMTEEEASRYNQNLSDMHTLLLELSGKYITGAEPLENFWSNVDVFYSLGLQEMIDAKQAAYDRYLSE